MSAAAASSSSSSQPSSLTATASDQVAAFKRKLGYNELFCNFCHSHGNLNVMCGLTLLTRKAVDEGLLKCALQEFQHRYPQLISRIRSEGGLQSYFVPMECPTLPLDVDFKCRDMLHAKFDTDQGPLWRVQLITEATMDKAALAGFGPEVAAIVEDDSPESTRWRYFLRYFQGKWNGCTIANFDEEEEGFRSFILITFHPAITDTLGSFHLCRQFLLILDSILEQDGNTLASLQPPEEATELHKPIEQLLPASEASGIHLGDFFQMAKMVGGFMMPRRSPFEGHLARSDTLSGPPRTEMLRGWLDEEQTSELLAMLEEDDASLHGVLLAAGLIAISRLLQETTENPPASKKTSLRATNEANLRQYCSSSKHGVLTTYYESDHEIPTLVDDDRAEFWRFAHELTVKMNTAKGNREPLKMLRIYNKMFSLSGGPENALKDLQTGLKIQNELGVATYGDMGGLFRRGEQGNCFDRPLSGPRSPNNNNLRLEDVFHVTAAPGMGSPFTHTAHILFGRLNYILLYHTVYVGHEAAFRVRDEVLQVLRMATEHSQ